MTVTPASRVAAARCRNDAITPVGKYGGFSQMAEGRPVLVSRVSCSHESNASASRRSGMSCRGPSHESGTSVETSHAAASRTSSHSAWTRSRMWLGVHHASRCARERVRLRLAMTRQESEQKRRGRPVVAGGGSACLHRSQRADDGLPTRQMLPVSVTVRCLRNSLISRLGGGLQTPQAGRLGRLSP